MTAPDRTSRKVSIVPPQHGAWAFLGLPVATAVTVSPWSPLLVLLAVTWVAAYPASYFLLATTKDAASRHPHPGQYRRPLILWWAVTLGAGPPLLALRPWLVWVGLVYAASFTVNLAFARRRDERALANDLVFIAQCTLMVPVTWAVAVGTRSLTPPSLADAPAHLWVLTVAVALVLIGSTLHVKSLIRERANAGFRRSPASSRSCPCSRPWAWRPGGACRPACSSSCPSRGSPDGPSPCAGPRPGRGASE